MRPRARTRVHAGDDGEMPEDLTLPPHTHAVAPAWEAAEVQVSLNGQDFHGADGTLHYHYYPHPTLTALTPSGGPAAAEGHTVLVHGSGFAALDAHRDASTPACRFGVHPPQPAVWYNDTAVRCAVPTGVPPVDLNTAVSAAGGSVGGATGLGAGAHDVQISLNGVDWPLARRTPAVAGRGAAGGEFVGGTARDEPYSPSLSYVVYMQPVVVGVTPYVGPEAGGILATIHGTGFNRFGQLHQARCDLP